MQVLIVDDDQAVRKELRAVLGKHGRVCHEAENGLAALKLAPGRRYDLIISDFNMPALDGLKFVRRIRSSEYNADTPVLMLTSLADKNSVMRAREIGVQGYVMKPFEPEELLARVKAVIS